ncbi:MAG: DNA alkylation repair protein [Anaerolineae bacterium]|nr:DNA alkylation repair protein [Anaerolineae bacterium]
MTYDEVLSELEARADPDSLAGMARFGITPARALGVRLPALRRLARRIGTDRALAAHLWEEGVRETQILASMVDDPAQVTEDQMESWAAEFSYWEICDQVCMNLFARTPLAWAKALEWSARPQEFVKRAGFVLMACLAVSDKKAADGAFEPFFPLIERQSDDDRTNVRKAVNWALRQIGKRNPSLWRQAVAVARRLASGGDRTSRWIGRDALKELTSEAVRERLQIE